MSKCVLAGWSALSLGDCGKWYSGGTPDTTKGEYWSGDIPWITSSSLKEFFIRTSERRVTSLGAQNGTRIVPSGTILFVVRGMSLKKEFRVGITCRPVTFGQDCKALIVNEGIDNLFLAYALHSKSHEILGLVDEASHGTGRLQTSLLQSVSVLLPPLPEQRKIAQSLSTWDEAIATVEQLIAALQRRKQGLMQRLLVPAKDTGQPAARLPSFSQQWQVARFDQVFTRATRKNDVGNQTVLTASGQHGLISQADFFKRRVASESLDGYYLLQRGEFAYNRSSMNGYPYGAIKRLETYEAGVLSTLYLCFALADEQSDARFYKHFFEAGGMNRGIYSIAQEGARNHGLLNVGVTDFFQLSVPVPSLQEQQRLADLFDVVDQQLDIAIKQRNALVAQKKGLMQRLLTGQVRVQVEEQP